MYSFEEILRSVNGDLVKLKARYFEGISTDSRKIKRGELFIPLTGKKFDGHDFIREAMEKAHSGTLCKKERIDSIIDLDCTIISVRDTHEALLRLASAKRERLGSKFVAITGSCGKTTTKELLVNILKRSLKVSYNEKNYNNQIGVPISLLSIEGEPDVCVFELGTNLQGEIKNLTLTVRPHISAITNIYPAHLEGLRNLEGVIEEKLDIFRYTEEGGIILINSESPIKEFRDPSKKTFLFGKDSHSQFSFEILKDLKWDGFELRLRLLKEEVDVRTNLIGFHNIYNVVLASAISYLLGIKKETIKEGIEDFSPTGMRMFPIISKDGFRVIDDTYNANPASMEGAIRTFFLLPSVGRKVIVLGDMSELGEESERYHRDLAPLIRACRFDSVLLYGEMMRIVYEELKGQGAKYFEEKGEIVRYLKETLREGDSVLIKGSRSMGMDNIVREII